MTFRETCLMAALLGSALTGCGGDKPTQSMQPNATAGISPGAGGTLSTPPTTAAGTTVPPAAGVSSPSPTPRPTGTAGTASVTAGTRAAVGGSSGSATAGSGTSAAGSGGTSGSITGGMGAAAGTAGNVSAGSGGGSTAGTGSTSTPGDCTSLPPVTDYNAKGPFADAKVFDGTGPSSNYTLFRPDASLGKDGFKHPIATWGNGIATTPDHYIQTLTQLATHGFVIIAGNDTMAERPILSAGLDWLVEQNKSGPMAGKLDITREITIGYSWGGGASIDTADRPNVKATVSLHGMPPRVSDAFDKMHSPLLLFTSTGDSFVTASGYVTPNYDKSKVQTFYATLQDDTAGHLYVADPGSLACVVSVALGECKGAVQERAPVTAWLRLWVCGDQGAKKYFYGDDCVLCKSPWTTPQRKNWK